MIEAKGSLYIILYLIPWRAPAFAVTTGPLEISTYSLL